MYEELPLQRQRMTKRRNYKNEGAAEEEEDRISSLTDELILEIMSFMNTKQAVQTCVLSKRWESVWKSLPYLNFESFPWDAPGKEDSKTVSLNNFIAQVISRRYHTNLVKVCLPSFECDPYTVGELIAYAVDHSVQQLTIPPGCNGNFVMPQSFYTCRSLTTLDVHWTVNLPKFLALPSLKSLHFSFHHQPMDASFFNPQFLKSCPNLETLKLGYFCFGEGITFFVDAPSLKRVEIRSDTFGKFFGRFARTGIKVMIDAPKLSSFLYRGYVPVVCSSDDLASIDDVYFDICYPYISKFKEENEEFDEMFLRLINNFKVFRHAKSLTLSFQTVVALARFPSLLEANWLPWPNLKYLKIEREGCSGNEVEIPQCVLNFFLNSSTKFFMHRCRYR